MIATQKELGLFNPNNTSIKANIAQFFPDYIRGTFPRYEDSGKGIAYLFYPGAQALNTAIGLGIGKGLEILSDATVHISQAAGLPEISAAIAFGTTAYFLSREGHGSRRDFYNKKHTSS